MQSSAKRREGSVDPTMAKKGGKGIGKTGADRADLHVTAQIERRIIHLAHMHTPDTETHWEKIYEPIRLAAAWIGATEMEVALPMHRKLIKKWSPVTTNWKLPPFRIDGQLGQGALTKSIGVQYEKVIGNFKKSTGKELAKWGDVVDAWTSCSQWFYHYWCLHPHLTKQQAFKNARALGERNVRAAVHTKKLMATYAGDKKADYWTDKVKTELLALNRHEVPETEDDEAIVYFTCADEENANQLLREFLLSRHFKLGNSKDMIALARRWYNTRAGKHDKIDFKQFLLIKSIKEVDAFKKKVAAKERQNATRKRKREEIEAAAIKQSQIKVSGDFLTHCKEVVGSKEIEAISKLQAMWNASKLHGVWKTKFAKLKKRRERPQKKVKFSAVHRLAVIYDPNCYPNRNPGSRAGHKWKLPDGSGLELQRELFEDIEIPTLEGMDDTVDNGAMKEKVMSARRFLRLYQNHMKGVSRPRSGKLLLELRASVIAAAKAEIEYARLSDAGRKKPCAVCSELVEDTYRCFKCRETIHTCCGHVWDNVPEHLTCTPCCKANGTMPPLLVKQPDGSMTWEKPGEEWMQMTTNVYVVLMNVTNCLHAKGLVLPAFHQLAATGEIQAFSDWPAGACRAAVALSMHDVKTMGVTPAHVKASLSSWMSPLYAPLFPLYMQSVYELFTLDGVVQCSKNWQRADMDKTIKKVADRLKKYEYAIFDAARNAIVRMHDKAMAQERTGIDIDLSYVLEDEEEAGLEN